MTEPTGRWRRSPWGRVREYNRAIRAARQAEQDMNRARSEAQRLQRLYEEAIRGIRDRLILLPEPLSEEDASKLAVEAVRRYREERPDERGIVAPAPGPEEVKDWARRREDRREAEGYQQAR